MRHRIDHAGQRAKLNQSLSDVPGGEDQARLGT
jgi:hypothetical protein